MMILTTNSRILIAAIFTVGVSVALPGIVYTTAIGFAFELELSTLEFTLGFVTFVAAVVNPVANCHARRAISIRALEHAWTTVPWWASGRLVRTILAILLAVASAIQLLS